VTALGTLSFTISTSKLWSLGTSIALPTSPSRFSVSIIAGAHNCYYHGQFLGFEEQFDYSKECM